MFLQNHSRMLSSTILLACISVPALAVDNAKIQHYGVYQTPDRTIWMRCALGQTWTGKTCKGKAKEYDWYTAQKIAKNFTYKGLTGWRLPTIKELHALAVCSNGFTEKVTLPTAKGKKETVPNLCAEGSASPTINGKIFPNTTEGLYWSSSTDAIQNGFAWYTYFGGGHSNLYNMKAKNHVRLVKIPVKREK